MMKEKKYRGKLNANYPIKHVSLSKFQNSSLFGLIYLSLSTVISFVRQFGITY
jgi:hypothetical protein